MKKKNIIIIGVTTVLVIGIILFAIFNSKGGNNSSGTIKTARDIKHMINSIYKGVDLLETDTKEINVSNKEEVEAYTGLTSNKDVELLVVSEPLMNAQAYSLVVLKAKDGADIEKMKLEMKENIDMDKWICVSASNLYITNNGNLIFMIMSSDDWAKPVYDNFKKYVNNNIGKELTKSNNIELPDELLVN